MGSIETFCKIDKLPCKSNVKGYEDHFRVLGFHWRVKYGYDVRMQKGHAETDLACVTISKLVDQASPQLAEVVSHKLKIDKVLIQFVDDQPGKGGRNKFFTYELENCRIVSVQWQAGNVDTDSEEDEHGSSKTTGSSTGADFVETIQIVGQIHRWEEKFNSKKAQYDHAAPDAKKAV